MCENIHFEAYETNAYVHEIVWRAMMLWEHEIFQNERIQT